MAFVRKRAIGAVAAVALGGGAAAAHPVTASTALHRCGPDTCLVVSGHRADAAAPIRIAGHIVNSEGGRNWRTIVSLADVQAWSPPAARSISVEVAGPTGGTVAAALPIGLLGQVTELAALDVSVRR